MYLDLDMYGFETATTGVKFRELLLGQVGSLGLQAWSAMVDFWVGGSRKLVLPVYRKYIHIHTPYRTGCSDP